MKAQCLALQYFAHAMGRWAAGVVIAVGTPTSMVMNENKMPAISDWPETNMWWPHTKKLTAAMPTEESAMAL